MYCKCTQIKNDLFDISGRLREIDKGYFVVYSYKKRRFEVHNRHQRGGSFCLAVPYDRLDCRTLSLVRRTRSERAAELFLEMEAENQKRERELAYCAAKQAELNAEKILK